MANWSVPIFDRGDYDADQTFIGVGMVMSAWEATEFEFSRLYSYLVGDSDTGPSMAQYGTGTIFRERINGLSKQAERYFVSNCSQHLEGRLSCLVADAIAAADRRNEVAHGIVLRIDNLTYFREQIPVSLLTRIHFALIPPYYLARKHRDGLPTYAYRYRDLEYLARRLVGLSRCVADFRADLLGPHGTKNLADGNG